MVGGNMENVDCVKVNWDAAFKKFEEVISDWQNMSISMKG